MFELYNFEGTEYKVSPDQLDKFLSDKKGAYKVGKITGPSTSQSVGSKNTGSGSGDGGSVFSGTGWGKPTTFVNTGLEQDEDRGTFKVEQTSTFENIPGATTIPKIKGFENLSNESKVNFYNNQLGDDGFETEVYESSYQTAAPDYSFTGMPGQNRKDSGKLITEKGVTITAPNGEVENFALSTDATSGEVSTEQDIANFINRNKLSKEENRKLDNKRYKAQRFLNNNFVEEFSNVITEKELNGIDDNAISPIKALQKKNPVLFDDIRNNIMEKYEEKTGETLDLTNYQIESLFENVVTSKKNEQILASSNLLKTIQDDYKSGEYNYSWDEMVKFSTYTNVNNFTQPEKKLYTSIQKYKNGTLKQIQDLENHPNFDENSDEYKSLLKQQEEEKGIIKGNLEKYQGDDAKFYVDYSTGEQIDQDFEDTENPDFEKYDITEEVNNYTRSIVENAGGKDDKSFNDNLTMAYERDAVESAHFNSHNQFQKIDFTVSPAMHAGFSDNEIGFKKRLKRLGYDLPEIGGSIKNIPVNVILNNWDLFKNHLDGAHQPDADDINTNYLGEEIKDWKDIGGYLKATKDMSVSMIARDRAWSQLHLLNIDPSSYKRDKSDLYFSGLVKGLPWADDIQQSDADERIARNFRGGAMSSDQMITNSQNLIDEVNERFVTEGIAPIKVSKKQIENLEKSRSEDFATAAGGFTPMVGEFLAAGGVTNGLLKVSKAGQYLNKIKATTYLTRGGREIPGAAVKAYSIRTGKSIESVAKKWNLVQNTGKTWQKGLHLLTYSAIEEGKMQLLDPLFGTEMPTGSGFGFYIGGTVAKGLLPFKFGSQGSKFSQTFGRMANPVWEKVVKGGFGGAVAAEVALPVEQLLGGHKSWQRWHEETYPDMNTIERRFTGNLALFGAFGFQHFNKTDAAFTVGMGKYYQNKWNKKAIAFGEASNAFSSPNRGNTKDIKTPFSSTLKKNTITVDGKEYTKEQSDANYQKYLELSSQAGKYVNISEKVPEYQNPYEQKKMINAQFEKINADAIKATGKPLFRVNITTDGKNHDARVKGADGEFKKQPDAYWKQGKDGMSEIYIDARKVNDGQIPHEVYHHITNNHLKLNPEQNAALGAKIQNYVQKALDKSSRTDLDFMKFIEKNYGKEVLRYDKEGEIPANLIELLATNRGYDIFVSNNLISDIAFEYKKLTEKIFTGADGESRGGFAGKYLQPRLDLKDAATVVDYLARLASMSKGGEYNPNVINRLKEMLKDHRLSGDGKVYKKEADGFETIVSLSSANIAKQIKLKDALKPLQEAYFAGKMSREEYYEKQAGLRAALVGIRDGDETKVKEKPEYKRTIDETFSEGKERVNKNFHNHQDIIVPTEGYENLIPSEKKLNREYIFDMVETYRDRIVAAGKGKFDTPTYENMSLKEKQNFVFENTREELIKHIERFNPETAVKLIDKTGEITGFKPKKGEKGKEYFDIDGYINSYVKLKEGTATKKNTKEFFSEKLDAEKANKIVDTSSLQEAEVSLSKQIKLKDVLPLQPGTMEAARGEMLKGRDIEVWKRFLRIHPKIVLDKASDVEALTLKTIENVVPELIRDMYSSKVKIDAVKEIIESKELFINEQVKAGEMTPKRAEELKKQLKKSRKEIEASLIATTIVDNIEAHKASVYSNVSEVTGMSTGLPNVMMSRKVKGKVEDVFLAKQKAGTKEGVKRVSAEMTTKTFDETGLKKKGNTAGNRPQEIIKLNNRQFLEKLGIKVEPDGEINIAEMLADRNILTSLVPALQNSVNKMVTNQLFESLAKEMKGGADIKTVNNLNRIITKAKSGRNFDLASFQIGLELFKNIVKENPNKEPEVWVSMFHNKDGKYRVMFPKKEALEKVDKDLDMSNQKKMIEISMKAGESDRVFEYVTDKHIKLKKGTFEIFSSYGGKSGRVVNSSLKELAVERDMDMKKLIIDKPLSDRNENHAEEYNVFREQIVEFMDPVLLAEKNVAAGTRYVLGEGQVQLGTNEMTTNSSGEPIRARLSAEQGKKLIADFMAGGEGTWAEFIKENPKYKNVNIKAMKVNDNADVMEKHHELLGTLEYLKINEPGPKGDAVRMKYVQEFRKSVLAQKGFEYQETMLANDAMLEYFVGTVNKVHKHFVDKGMPEFALNFTQQFYQNQTSAGKGFIRGLASHNAVTTQRATNLPQKLKKGAKIGENEFSGELVDIVSEGYRSEHEFQAANFGGNMVVNHVKYHSSAKDFKAIYDPIARSFRQTIIPKYVQKVIDKDGNTRSIYEEAGTSLDMTSKTNFLIDRVVAETTIDLNSGKDYAGILTNKVAALQIYKNLQSIAKKTGVLPSKGVSKHQMIINARTLDKAIELGRKKKKARGGSFWDFDDTLVTTKSGVRARIPNADGKPKPNRKVIFLAGGAGSGKGNVIEKLKLEKQGFKTVNSDISLEWLKKNSGLPENMNDFTKEQRSKLGSLQHQARDIAKGKMMKYQGEAGGVVVDGTGGSIKSMEKLVNEFKDKGYDVSMLFVETSLETALARNKARVERSLLDKIVEKNHEAVQGNKEGFTEMFGERFMEVQTDNLKQTDAMPSELVAKMNDFVSGYEKIRLDAEQFATEGKSILDRGGEFDFAEFNVVTGGEKGPFFQKALDRAKKFGTKDQFVLTARPPEAAIPIHEFLKSQGLDIPLENITGLGNSTGEAKAMFLLEKFAEGYNDIYFADDAIQNVKAVRDALNQVDARSKVVQAKAINEVKDVDGLANPDTYGNILASKNIRNEFEKTIAKNRPDLVKAGLVSSAVDDMISFVEKLDVPINKRKKYQRITTKWLATSNIKLKEDGYKIKQAVELAEKHKEDIFSYRNPNELIEKYAGKTKAKPTNPKNVKEFGEGRVFNKKHGITVHEVADTREGMMSVREIADTHWGPKSNPWCIIARSEKQRVEPRQYGYESVATKSEAQARKQQLESEGFIVEIKPHSQIKNGLEYELDIKEVKEGPGVMEDAWQNWTVYGKSRKYIVFQNGRLSSFYADNQYWDRMDSPTDAPVVRVKKGNVTSKVELVPVGDGKVSEFVMETRTTSKDKKTVTTEILHETQDGYEVGTEIIENRVNGITVKSTRSRPGFDRQGNDVMHTQEIINFDKSGKATNNVTFNPEGLARAINRYGMPFGEMSIRDIVQKKGDLLSHEINDGDISYYYGDVLINGQKTEIGWGMLSTFDLRDFVKTSPNGEVRADLKKILEVDPNTKGLPKEVVKPQIKEGMQALEPVKRVLDQLDIKSDVQQALASKNIGKEINKIMEHSLDIESKKVFSKAEAKVRGKDIKRRRIFMRDSAADLELLIEPLYGKGKEGIKNKEWFREEFVMPFERGVRDYNTARQSAKNDYMGLRKNNKDVVKEISKPVEGTAFTNDMAMRVYLWNKAGYKIPDLAKGTEAKLVQHITNNPKLQAYAENFARITKQDKGLKEPGENWWGETMAGEVTNINRGVSRKQYLQEWIERKNEMFTEENLNKMESKLGTEWRENIEDMFDRMETGRTRSLKLDRGSAIMMNYLNGGIGTIMNFNTRSAVLQTISTTNFLNMRENNPIAAAMAMGNVKQFSKDFMYIMNSDMLKQRRDGLAINVTEAEIASAAASSQNPVQSIISKVLKAGYLPTKLADSFAISLGGATFYRNRIKMYEKQGMETKEAESKAFLDFQVLAERTQQSSRADLLSKQQTSLIGRFILPFANTPMQMNRAGMKDILDISKGRFKGGRELSEKIGRITYYMGAQVAIFAGLQSALFAMLLNDEDVTDEKLANTKSMMMNSMSDSMLRGFGIQGAVLSATKNAIQEFIKQESKPGFTADYSEVAEKLLNVSPPIGSKFGMLDSAGDKKKWARIKKNDEFKFELGNPSLEASLMTIQATTNAPVYSPYQNFFNMQHALNDQYETWQRMLMASGWTPYSVGIEDRDEVEVKVLDKTYKRPTYKRRVYTR